MPSRRNTLLPLQFSTPDTWRMLRRRESPIELSRVSTLGAWPFPELITLLDDATATGLAATSNPCGPMAVPMPCVQLQDRWLRITHAGELPGPWNELIDQITLVPREPLPDMEDQVAESVHVRAMFAPMAATLADVPLESLELFETDWSHDRHYVFDTPYPQAREALRALIEDQLADGEQMSEDGAGGHGGLFIENDDGGVWLHPHPDNANLTVLAIARVE